MTASVPARGRKPNGSPGRPFGGIEITESNVRLGHHHVKRDGFLVGVLGFGFREKGDAGLERSTHRLSATRAQPFADPTNFERLHGFRSRGEVVERQVTQFFGLVETAGGLGDSCTRAAARSSGDGADAAPRRGTLLLRRGRARSRRARPRASHIGTLGGRRPPR
jgi:hypothetical protein